MHGAGDGECRNTDRVSVPRHTLFTCACQFHGRNELHTQTKLIQPFSIYEIGFLSTSTTTTTCSLRFASISTTFAVRAAVHSINWNLTNIFWLVVFNFCLSLCPNRALVAHLSCSCEYGSLRKANKLSASNEQETTMIILFPYLRCSNFKYGCNAIACIQLE